MNLGKTRNTESFLERISIMPRNSRESIQAVINNFTKFADEKHQSTPDQICKELKIPRKNKVEDEYGYALYQLLQDWIDWNKSRNIGAYAQLILKPSNTS